MKGAMVIDRSREHIDPKLNLTIGGRDGYGY